MLTVGGGLGWRAKTFFQVPPGPRGERSEGLSGNDQGQVAERVYGVEVIDNDGVRLGIQAAHRLALADCCEIEPGLSEAEFRRIEAAFGIEFSADHRAFLAAGLPVAEPPEEGATWDQPWPNWRHGDHEDLRYRLEWPVQGVLNSVGNGWWEQVWGPRPADDSAALQVAKQELAHVPQLVPVYAHRFVPAGGGAFGHPVLSIWGIDIICYGQDLADYIDHEFREADEDAPWSPQPTVAFWKDFICGGVVRQPDAP
ncbi:hypothetical protein [Streptomyces sp. NPDC048248]|uniref:hypothetical protein n=1 Tax=Streptomyces sp. NPDC048248 TaxID=3365523 RepID=UPI00371EB4BC